MTNKRIQCDVFPPLFSSAAETKICHFRCFYKPLKSCNIRKYQGEDAVDLFFLCQASGGLEFGFFVFLLRIYLGDWLNKDTKEGCRWGQPFCQSRPVLVQREKQG